ncbi:alpha/beta fold hydrolase [Thiocystis violacea]|uniref:alpha/beta fold hydrolase n=1 Tax=Thiocystis violacea TaxID=13725 RepID=UPI00190675AD|nr:alpha/beta fold hydrolase [Thiocystis violacea]MBK1716281.1 alpha/beta hydrolase [Thiocystis violacea]
MDSAINPTASDKIERRVPLPGAVDAPRYDLRTEQAGRIHYYADATAKGRPLVLIHSINAAPSVFEMKPLFEHFRPERPVYALDLPGFGHSDRDNRRYSPELFAGVIAEFLERVVKEPADLAAFSLGCEFAARAALMKPDLVTSLALISPTGFNIRGLPTGQAAERAYKFLSVPVINDGLFGLLTTRPSIRYFLNQAFVGATPPELVDYAHATTHQPGAKYAPLYFLSGQLFTPKAGDTLYNQVTQPVLVLYDKDPNIDFHELPDFLTRHANWRAERIAPTRGMPQWEKPAETAAAITRFWDSLG